MPGQRSNAPPVPYFEPAVVPDVFVDGLAFVEDRGDIVRLVFWAEHTSYDTGEGRSERQISHRLVMTKDAFRNLIHTLGVRVFRVEAH